MLSRWSIQYKLLLCVALLCLIVATLAVSGFRGVYSYRQLARTISLRASELPVAGDLSKSLGDLRVTLSRARPVARASAAPECRASSCVAGTNSPTSCARGRRTPSPAIASSSKRNCPTDPRFGDRSHELRHARQPGKVAGRAARQSKNDPAWVLDTRSSVRRGADRVDEMYDLAGTLPNELHDRMHDFAKEVRRSSIAPGSVVEWIAATLAGAMFAGRLLALFYVWVVAPLRVLIAGSRRIAQQDDFDHRIHLKIARRDGRAGRGPERHDGPLPGNPQRPRRSRSSSGRRKSSAASSSPASAFWRPAWPTRSTTRWPRSPGAPNRSKSRLHDTLHGDERDADRRAAGRSRNPAQVPAPHSGRSLPLQGNHREAARFFAAGRRARSRTPTWAS